MVLRRWTFVGLLIFVVPMTVILYRSGTRLSYIFFVGSMILVLGAIIAFIKVPFLEPILLPKGIEYNSYAAMRVIAVFEYAFFAIALGYKTRLIQEDKNRAELEALDAQFKALKAQLNPHFIFNCLNSIKGLIKKNENIIAEEYLESFANLTRNMACFLKKAKKYFVLIFIVKTKILFAP